MNEGNGTLIMTVRKEEEMVVLILPDKREVKIIVKDHPSGNKNRSKVLVNCPRDVRIYRASNKENEL